MWCARQDSNLRLACKTLAAGKMLISRGVLVWLLALKTKPEHLYETDSVLL